MRVLVTGWFSLDDAEVTGGDLLARDTAVRWLCEEGVAHDVAVAANFRRVGELALAETDPDRYTDVLFVCGPVAGAAVGELFARFPSARRLALDVSVVPGTAVLRLDGVLARDDGEQARPDLSLGSPTARTPVVGVVLTHEQPEYGDRHRMGAVHAALDATLLSHDVAPLLIDTRLHPGEALLCSTPGQLESALARCDAVLTTRLHGLVLSLKVGVPVVAVDPVAGGGKVSAQAAVLGWPCLAAEEADAQRLAELLTWCLSAGGRAAAGEVVSNDRLVRVRADFLALLAVGA